MRDVRTLLVVGLVGLSAFLLGRQAGGPAEPAWAQQAPGSYGGGTVSTNGRYIAATGSVGSGMSVLWLVDTEARRVVVYGTSNLGKTVELRAARNIEWDLRLDEYNDESQYKAEDLERLARRRQDRQPPKDGPVKAGDTPAGGAGDVGTGEGK